VKRAWRRAREWRVSEATWTRLIIAFAFATVLSYGAITWLVVRSYNQGSSINDIRNPSREQLRREIDRAIAALTPEQRRRLDGLSRAARAQRPSRSSTHSGSRGPTAQRPGGGRAPQVPHQPSRGRSHRPSRGGGAPPSRGEGGRPPAAPPPRPSPLPRAPRLPPLPEITLPPLPPLP
jgi:hypothetical protein